MQNSASRIKALALGIIAASLTACSSTQVQNFNDRVTTIGKDYGAPILCVTGTVVGAAAGYAINEKKGLLAGAAVGGALGCAVGVAWQNHLQELDRIAKEEQLSIAVEQVEMPRTGQQVKGAGLVAQIEDNGMFPSGSAQLTADGRRSIRKLAELYAQGFQGDYGERRLLVVGHTDATGGAALNQRLSEQRAKAVGTELRQAGIPAEAIFYQGAGASRPTTSNANPLLRGKNRRVEITEVTSEAMLSHRIATESSNAKYLQYGTATTTASSKPKTPVTPQSRPLAKPAPVTQTAVRSTAQVDFAGVSAASQPWMLGQLIAPKASGFTFIRSVHASLPMSDCTMDMPRISGEVRSLATGNARPQHATRDHLAGYNRVWANTVNNHLVTIAPVSILRDGARVGKQPFLQIVENYGQVNSKTHTTIAATANTYEGENEVLYRAFATDQSAAITCIDVVFNKQKPEALGGSLFYEDRGEHFTAAFVPVRN